MFAVDSRNPLYPATLADMPELPEVETVRRALAEHVLGRYISSIDAEPVRLRRQLDQATLAARLPGRRIEQVRRRGKYLLVDLAPPGSLLLHLGMSGRLTLQDSSSPRPRHTHLVLCLDDGRQLRFIDPRRFGMVIWLDPADEPDEPSLARLGLEPLDPRLPELLPPLLKDRRVPLKSLLLDQRLLAGVGNIYATEALWRARIRPTRLGCATSIQRLQLLVPALQQVLQEAIACGGTTIRDFASLDESSGYFATRLDAYGRAGQPCATCTTPLTSSIIGGRTTVWCRRCQR